MDNYIDLGSKHYLGYTKIIEHLRKKHPGIKEQLSTAVIELSLSSIFIEKQGLRDEYIKWFQGAIIEIGRHNQEVDNANNN